MGDDNATRERWLKGAKKEPPARTTSSGLPVLPLATPEDVPWSYEEGLGNPGEFPFTRGPYGTMHASG